MRMPSKYYYHAEAWYFDPREWRVKLTDKATEEDIDSYIERFSTGFSALDYDELVKRTKADIEDFIKNKNRYTLKKDQFGHQELVAVDGKELDYLECLSSEEDK